jgi:transglutaminase-like putative cysteine protease
MPSRRDAPAFALAFLSCAAALSFGRVFADGSFAPPVLAVALVPHAVGLLGRRRRWSPATTVGVSLAALAIFVSWFLVPATTTFVVPGAGTLRELSHRFADGWDVYRTGRAPVPVTGGPVLLCVLATWTAAQAADWLAFRRDATVGAIVPGLVLFVLAATLGTAGLRTQVTLAFGAAAVVFLLFQQQALLERRRAWFTGRHLGQRASLLTVGSAVGVIALLAGLVVAPALPGADARAWFNYRQFGAGSGTGPGRYDTVSPLVDIKDRLSGPNSTAELFTVKSSRSAYWRVAALDTFDGEVWGIDSHVRDVRGVLPRRDTQEGTFTQTYTIKALDQQFLPAAFQAKAIDLDAARIVPESGTLISDSSSILGKRYTVVSVAPPNGETLRSDPAVDVPAPADIVNRYGTLPGNFPPSITVQALQIVTDAHAATLYAQALALQQYFLDNFTYSLSAPPGHSENAMVTFIREKAGFCEQFAGTYAAMARSLRIPARVAVGFTPGELESDGLYHVTGRNAHAWPEVYLGGQWVPFEPTPAGSQPGQPQIGFGPSGGTDTPTSTSTVTTAPGTTPSSQAGPRGRGANAAGELRADGGAAAGSSGHGTSAAWLAVLALGAVALLALATFPLVVLVGKARRRRRRREAPEPRAAVAGAWEEALDRLDEAGVARQPALTPLELASRVRAGAAGRSADALGRLATTYTTATFAPGEPDPTTVDAAWDAVDDLEGALHDGTGRLRRVRRRLDPRPLRRVGV